jgi:hypothetical protein
MTMRALIDTNVFVSYLLQPDKAGPVHAMFQGIIEEKFTLLVPEDLLEELTTTVRGRRQLAERIPPAALETLTGILLEFGEMVERIYESIPAVTRDPKDDYLLAYALVGGAEYLVTGDNDLLALSGQIAELEIVTPRAFANLLRD